jgi:hypothetical protein
MIANCNRFRVIAWVVVSVLLCPVLLVGWVLFFANPVPEAEIVRYADERFGRKLAEDDIDRRLFGSAYVCGANNIFLTVCWCFRPNPVKSLSASLRAARLTGSGRYYPHYSFYGHLAMLHQMTVDLERHPDMVDDFSAWAEAAGARSNACRFYRQSRAST